MKDEKNFGHPKRTVKGAATAFALLASASVLLGGTLLVARIVPAKNECASCQVSGTPSNPVEFLGLQQGAIAQISKGNLPSGGEFRSRLGKIDSTGNYTAPDFYAAGLTDRVEYWVNGTVYTSDILIKRNTLLPLRGASPVVASLQFDGITYLTEDVPDDGKWHEVIYPDHIEDQVVPTVCHEISDVTIVDDSDTVRVGAPLDTRIGDARTLTFLQATQLGVSGAQRCSMVGPLYPGKAPIGPCNSASPVTVEGPVKEYQKAGPWQDGGTVTVDLDLQGKIQELLGITVSVGAVVNIKWKEISYLQVKNKDRYVCKNGVYVYAGSETCTRSNSGAVYRPKWGGIVFGDPKNGAPNPAEWTPWSCAAI